MEKIKKEEGFFLLIKEQGAESKIIKAAVGQSRVL